ncbi:hypothetical protein [Haloplanus pelagicus]|jgi:hypothetical protein|uniref:hypothetical protein n=1 Tax=Haloplanus pelagicus TaxID=2949995 RepID=UPI00203E2D7F|nr:hypothetical protein [Haloplanus sp. HW8-1]
MGDRLNRRAVLQGVGVGVAAGLAGCSGSGGSESPESDTSGDGSNGGEIPDSASDTTTEPTETESSTSTQAESTGGEVVHVGEEELENYISTAGNPEDLPEGASSYTTVGQSEYEWVEFEDIRNQVRFDFGDFGNDDPARLDERGTLDSVDTFHLALRDSEGYETIWVGLQADEWMKTCLLSRIIRTFQRKFIW